MLVAAGKAVAAGDMEINETNFPDENFRSWLFMQSYGADGVITESEIKNITECQTMFEYSETAKGRLLSRLHADRENR